MVGRGGWAGASVARPIARLEGRDGQGGLGSGPSGLRQPQVEAPAQYFMLLIARADRESLTVPVAVLLLRQIPAQHAKTERVERGDGTLTRSGI